MTKDELLAQLDKNPNEFSIKDVPDNLRDDVDLMLAAVKETFDGSMNLQYASQRLLNNEDFALKVAELEEYGALEYFSDEIKDNENVVLAFIKPKNFGAEIQFASERVKGIPSLMKVAVISNSMALRYALPEQKKDVDLVWSAMFDGGLANDPIAFTLADLSIRKDPEFFKKVSKKLKDIKAHKDLVKSITESHTK